MTKHTAEPWTADGHGGYERKRSDGSPWRSLCIGKEDGRDIAEVCIPMGGKWTHAEAIANRDRIVACVNACAGYPTEALKAGALAALVAEATETLRNIACADGVATGLTQDVEALETALAKLRGEMIQPLRVQIYPTDQETGARGPLHWEGEFNAEVIEDDEERAEVEAKLRESGVAMVGGGAMPLVLILRADG